MYKPEYRPHLHSFLIHRQRCVRNRGKKGILRRKGKITEEWKNYTIPNFLISLLRHILYGAYFFGGDC
jgi:hypothetical protein